MSICFRRQPTVYLPSEYNWYGKNNMSIAEKFRTYNGEAAPQSFVRFTSDSQPKALVVFGTDPSLQIDAHARWLHSLCHRYDIMVITAENFSDLNVWFQNITSRTIKLSLLVFNVHGATEAFTFNPSNPRSGVSHETPGLQLALSSVLLKKSCIMLCACTTGSESASFNTEKGIYRNASIARLLAMLLQHLEVEVVAPSRTIIANSIRESNTGLKFIDGDEDITVRFGQHKPSLKELLPFPSLLKQQLDMHNVKEGSERQALIYDALNHLYFRSAIHLLQGYSGQPMHVIQQTLGTSVDDGLLNKEVVEQCILNRWISRCIESIEGKGSIEDCYLSLLGDRKVIIKMAEYFLNKGFYQEVLGLLDFVDTEISKDVLENFLKVFLKNSSFSSVKGLLAFCVKRESLNSLSQKILKLALEISEFTFQPREYSDFMRCFEKRRDFALAKDFLLVADKKGIYLAPKRYNLWKRKL